ncbi:MAG: ZIP family metal transporter [Lautropia sp.]
MVRHAQRHPVAAAWLAVGGLSVVVLLALGATGVGGGEQTGAGLRWAVAGGLAAFAATSLGALPALALQRIEQRLEDSLLGFAAGMMLAASAFSLLLPGIEAANQLLEAKAAGAVVVIAGMALGVGLMLGLDAFTPHEHGTGDRYGPDTRRLTGVWLFVFAIALHNLPEGMAIGVAFSRGDLAVGLPLASAIAIQDLPEGLAVALALKAAGLRRWPAVGIAAATGFLEPLGALLGVGVASGLPLAYPIGLGLAGGAMLFVVSHEVIPQTHRNGHQTPATIGLMIGFGLMMVLDTTLGA